MAFVDLLIQSPGPQLAALARLRREGRPVLVYGAAVYAYVVINYLRALGLEVRACAVDAAHHQPGTAVLGLEVLVIEEALRVHPECACVVGITNYPVASQRLQGLGVGQPLVVDVPDFLNIPDEFMDIGFVESNLAAFEAAHESWADPLSRATFVAAINAKLNQDPSHLLPVVRPDHLYFWQSEFALSKTERLLDVGGFDGDSIRDFHRITAGEYDSIVSLEPFDSSFQLLTRAARDLDPSGTRIRPVQCGAWDERARLPMAVQSMNIDNRIVETSDYSIQVDTIDHLVERLDFKPSLIKMDINGAESRAIAGARRCLQQRQSRLVVKLHVKEDFFRLPLLLKDIAPDMQIRLRQRNYMSMMLVLQASFD